VARGPRVVITGLGLVTGLGNDAETTWAAVRRGRTGLRLVEIPGAPTVVASPFAGPVPDGVDPTYAIQALSEEEALRSAGFDTAAWPYRAERVATLIGLSKGRVRGLSRNEGSAWLQSWPGDGPRFSRARCSLLGPSSAPVAACATGLVAVLQGANLVRWGDCDAALAGAVDASLEPVLIAAFRNMKVLARGDDPARAVRPWDRRRAGFSIGEGAALFVLERADRAEARGATPIVEVAGGAIGSDAYHITDLNDDATNLAGLIGRALDDAGVATQEVDYVNVHGTATPANDPLECRALRMALGRHADRVSCSANKAQVGHLLGAAGAAELALTCLAVRDQFAPPTLNLDDPDPACDLDGTPHVGRPRDIRVALKLSIGFGGHLAAAVLRRPGTGSGP
jgi:3-oxoacyl-[acyl-carrier-protein] synthase II